MSKDTLMALIAYLVQSVIEIEQGRLYLLHELGHEGHLFAVQERDFLDYLGLHGEEHLATKSERKFLVEFLGLVIGYGLDLEGAEGFEREFAITHDFLFYCLFHFGIKSVVLELIYHLFLICPFK
jgi:hypothetical protein